MSSQYRSITYLSTASQPMTPDGLEGLLREARALNRASGITGCLLYCDGSFMQCFGGSPAATAATWDRISRSKRHHSLTVLCDDMVDTLPFPDWLMAYSEPTRNELLALTTANWKNMLAAPGKQAMDSPGFQLLAQFWQNAHYRASQQG